MMFFFFNVRNIMDLNLKNLIRFAGKSDCSDLGKIRRSISARFLLGRPTQRVPRGNPQISHRGRNGRPWRRVSINGGVSWACRRCDNNGWSSWSNLLTIKIRATPTTELAKAEASPKCHPAMLCGFKGSTVRAGRTAER